VILEAENRGFCLGLGRVDTYVLGGLGWVFGIRLIFRADLEVLEFVDVIHLTHVRRTTADAHRPELGVFASDAVPQLR
jgi:hypothetical protein